jgi:hypothetical protein
MDSSFLTSINSLISNANDSVLCGPECLEKQKKEQAKTQLENAKRNLATAPQQLKDAEKEYILLTEGPSAWTAKDMTNQQESWLDSGKTLHTHFSETLTHVKEQNNSWTQTQTQLRYAQSMVKDYQEKRRDLEKRFSITQNQTHVNQRKTVYEDEELTYLNRFFSFFLFVYHIVLFVAVIGIIAFTNFSRIQKILWVILFIFFPYSIHLFWVPTFLFLLESVKRLYTFFIPENVYMNMTPLSFFS